ncbi:hypothetical protein N7507_005755 [Penicillium longicatenatum]|nr:hypothetical protein N7507_005755 [Penicillium longicatenatum]
MATATMIKLPVSNTMVMSKNVKEDARATVDELLRRNHLENHIAWHQERRNNHVVHHMLSIYALGATSDQIREHYKRAISVVPPAHPIDVNLSQSLIDREKWKIHIGDHLYYHSYLAFFEREIEAKGYINVMQEYLFAEDERAEDMLCRLFAGLLHPWIHLGFALEFQQPSLMAEALAQIATIPTWNFEEILLPAEKVAGDFKSKPLIEIMEDMRKDERVMAAPQWSNFNKLLDVIANVPDALIKYASQFTVTEDQLDEKVAELMETSAYVFGATQRPGKVPRIEFLLMHCVTSNVFLSNVLYHPSISARARVRMLEWKGRADLIIWASCKCPRLYPARVMNYPVTKNWDALIQWSLNHPDEDSHYIKTLRALMQGQKVGRLCRDQGKKPKLMISDMTWLQVGNMLVAAGEGDPKYVRYAGFDEAWDGVQDERSAAEEEGAVNAESASSTRAIERGMASL